MGTENNSSYSIFQGTKFFSYTEVRNIYKYSRIFFPIFFTILSSRYDNRAVDQGCFTTRATKDIRRWKRRPRGRDRCSTRRNRRTFSPATRTRASEIPNESPSWHLALLQRNPTAKMAFPDGEATQMRVPVFSLEIAESSSD